MSPTPPSQPAEAAKRANGGNRRLWRNTGFSLLQQGVSIALAVALVPYMLWRLGTEQYGLWLILQIFNILGLVYLAELGFQGAIVRHLVRHHAAGERKEFRHLVASGLLLFLAIGLVVGSLVLLFAQTAFTRVFAIAPEHAEEMRLALSVYAASLVIGFPALIIKSFFTGMQNLALQKIWETLDRLIFTIGVVALLFFTDRLLFIVLLEQAVALTLLGGFALLARRRYGAWFTISPREARRSSLRGVLGLSGAVFSTNLTNQVFTKGPEAMIGAILGPVLLAHYQIATRLPRVLKTVAGALNAAVLPHMSALDTGDADKAEAARRFTLAGLRANYLIFVPAAVAMMAFATPILVLWVGGAYAFLAPFLAAYAAWQITTVAVNFSTATLTRTEHYRNLIRRNVIAAIVFLAVLFFLIERGGLPLVFGALLASGLLNATAAIDACRRAHRLRLGDMAKHVLVGPILGSAALGLALLMPASLILQVYGLIPGVAAMFCAGLAYLFGWYWLILHVDERGWLKTGLAKMRRKQ
jgi:O-antigen/teichoic acid export membrane protein